MNLLKELEPYADHINAYIRGFGMTNKEVTNALVDIWDRWKNIPEISKQIYGSEKTLPKTDKGCSGCVSSAIKNVVNWKKHLETEGRVYHKLVPQKPLAPKQPLKPKEIDIESLTWPELKNHAKSKGIKIHGKKKAELIKELKSCGTERQ